MDVAVVVRSRAHPARGRIAAEVLMTHHDAMPNNFLRATCEDAKIHPLVFSSMRSAWSGV
jgi:hypothetical protein